MSNRPWIPVAGKDAGPNFPKYLNPDLIQDVTFWTDPSQQRVATVARLGGTKIDLREREAIDALGALTRGGEPAPTPAPVCSRR